MPGSYRAGALSSFGVSLLYKYGSFSANISRSCITLLAPPPSHAARTQLLLRPSFLYSK